MTDFWDFMILVLIPSVLVPCYRLIWHAFTPNISELSNSAWSQVRRPWRHLVFLLSHNFRPQDPKLQYLGVDNYLFYGKVVTWPKHVVTPTEWWHSDEWRGRSGRRSDSPTPLGEARPRVGGADFSPIWWQTGERFQRKCSQRTDETPVMQTNIIVYVYTYIYIYIHIYIYTHTHRI